MNSEAQSRPRGVGQRQQADEHARTGKEIFKPCLAGKLRTSDASCGVRVQARSGYLSAASVRATVCPISPNPINPTVQPVPLATGGSTTMLALLRLVPRKIAMPAKHHECDVLRHACGLQSVPRPRDRHARRQIARGEQLVDTGAGAGDERKRG